MLLWEARESAIGQKRKLVHDHTTSDTFLSGLDNIKKRRISQGRAVSDEMAAATAILCVHELQEAPGMGWLRHLEGTKSLLDIVEGSMMPLQARTIASVSVSLAPVQQPSGTLPGETSSRPSSTKAQLASTLKTYPCGTTPVSRSTATALSSRAIAARMACRKARA